MNRITFHDKKVVHFSTRNRYHLHSAPSIPIQTSCLVVRSNMALVTSSHTYETHPSVQKHSFPLGIQHAARYAQASSVKPNSKFPSHGIINIKVSRLGENTRWPWFEIRPGGPHSIMDAENCHSRLASFFSITAWGKHWWINIPAIDPIPVLSGNSHAALLGRVHA